MKLFTSVRNQISAFVKSEEGASAIEYAVIAGLIIAGAATAIGLLGIEVTSVFTNITNAL